MLELSAKNGLCDRCDVIKAVKEKLRIWQRTFHAVRNSGAANTVLFTIQTFNEHWRMAKLSQPYLFTRPHAMKRHKILLPMLRNGELKFWTPVNFEVDYFLN